ncbi:cupin domain-containing protein [Larkinella insperata]|uniref:Cupin domain-containing protein n=1 Tax=Larkinella insperata TaxID=332158 RepID=A0ABW3QC47_9BACT|nr:cupin domain-containing protein [Larkinella insperata]
MHQPAEQALRQLQASGKEFLELFGYGTLSLEVYKPVGQDRQLPHERDEVYFIISGSGIFDLAGTTYPFRPGDFFFVPARAQHRFQQFTDDFATWVIFYGPEGGEAP